MVELVTKSYCRVCVLGSQAAPTERSLVPLGADAEIHTRTKGACVGSWLGDPYLWANEGRIQKAKLNYKAVAKAAINAWEGALRTGWLYPPSDTHPNPCSRRPRSLYSYVPQKAAASFNGVTRIVGRQVRTNSLSLITQDTESEGQSGLHTTTSTREPRRQECVPEVRVRVPKGQKGKKEEKLSPYLGFTHRCGGR